MGRPPALHVTEKGADRDGTLVVLVHGSMDRGAGMARVARALDDRHVVRYDRRGYGRSRFEGPGATLDEHVDDLLAIVAGRPTVVVGHSYGGVVALTAATRAPDVVAGVVAFEAPMPWRPWWPSGSSSGSAAAVARSRAGGDPGDAAEAFLRRMLGDERWEALPRRTREERRAEGVALVAEAASLRTGAVPFRPEELGQPVVSGCGTASSPHLVRAAEVLAAEAPCGELVAVEGAPHGCHLSHPTAFAGLVRRCLELVEG